MRTIEELEKFLTAPSRELLEDIKKINGDLMILGVGGKMGPTLAKLAKNAFREAGMSNRVIGVSRFSDSQLQKELEDNGIETIACDLLNDDQVQELPEVDNIIFMAGHKFGTKNKEHLTWTMNTYMPGRIAQKFKNSRIVSFSTGNVYPLTPVLSGGAQEDTTPEPVGEYAQSCLGRERVFNYYAEKYGTPVLHFRLNYAIDMRYGVLLEIAKSIYNHQPIDLEMGHVNVIWQGDANERAIRSLLHCNTPPKVLNITGPECISVRWLAQEFGKIFDVEPQFVGAEQATALLNNASLSNQLFGYPKVSLRQMINWIAEWVEAGGVTHQKPTHFQERKGVF